MSETSIIPLDVLTIIEELSPVLNSEAPAAREAGELTPRAKQALIDSEVIAMLAPKSLGGAEVSLSTYLHALIQLLRADGPAGWCTMAMSAHVGLMGAGLPDDGVAELFAGSDHPRLPGMSAPIGRADKVDGGYRVSGKFQFASGSMLATHFVAGATVYENGAQRLHEGAPETILAVVPLDAVTQRGNWDVDGLEPTESVDYDIEGTFVPDRLALQTNPAFSAVRGPTGMGAGVPAIAAAIHGAASLGLTQRLLEEIAALAPTRGRGPGQTVADNDVFKHEIALRDIELRAARTQYFAQIDEIQQFVDARGGPVPAEMTARLLQLNAYMHHEVGMKVANLAYTWAGSAAFRNNSAIGRFYRDMSVARQHVMADRNNLAAHGELVRSALSDGLSR